jgi:hypothetical protein
MKTTLKGFKEAMDAANVVVFEKKKVKDEKEAKAAPYKKQKERKDAKAAEETKQATKKKEAEDQAAEFKVKETAFNAVVEQLKGTNLTAD